MPKNKVSDPITDQEMAFARQVLSGGMTDRHAAEAVGLNPDSAAYPNPNPMSAPTCSSTAPPLSNSSSSRGPLVPVFRGATPPSEPGPRKSPGPPLGIANLSAEITAAASTGRSRLFP